MIRIFFIVFCLAICLAYPFAHAQAQQDDFSCLAVLDAREHNRLLQQVDEQYRRYSTLHAEFRQQSYFVGLNQRVASRGHVWFRKPGMMDWSYEEPEAQRFVADGQTLWFYQPGLNQVTLGDFKQAFDSDLPVSFLLGVGKLPENFRLSSACAAAAGTVLELAPLRPDPNLQQFYLLVDKVRHAPLGARVIDIGGNETVISLSGAVFDAPVAEERFKFQIPRGADVIDKRQAGAPLQQSK